LNVPAACEKVYMKYNTVSGTEATKEFALSTFNFHLNLIFKFIVCFCFA